MTQALSTAIAGLVAAHGLFGQRMAGRPVMCARFSGIYGKSTKRCSARSLGRRPDDHQGHDVMTRWQATVQDYLTLIQETAHEIEEKARRLEQIAQQMKRGTR